MVASVTHTFVSAKSDDADATLVRPSNWNAGHTLTEIATLGANTFTAQQTITQASANAGVLASTGYSVTGSNTTKMVDLAGTVNTSGIVDGVYRFAVTTTAIGAQSALFKVVAGAAANETALHISEKGIISGRGVGTRAGYGLLLSGDPTSADSWTVRITTVGSMYWYTDGGASAARWAGSNAASQMRYDSGTTIAWSQTNNDPDDTRDLGIKRAAAKVLALTDASTGGASLELTEMTAPAAGATNKCRIYCEDNGSGKTRLMAKFATGAAVQIAIEP